MFAKQHDGPCERAFVAHKVQFLARVLFGGALLELETFE
jgi:hypothetical protein